MFSVGQALVGELHPGHDAVFLVLDAGGLAVQDGVFFFDCPHLADRQGRGVARGLLVAAGLVAAAQGEPAQQQDNPEREVAPVLGGELV